MQRITVLTLFLVFSATAHADNWPHWRGVAGNGVANASPPTEWSDTKNVKWKVRVPGRGSGSPVIWNNRVYVTTAVSATGSQSAAPRQRRPGGRRGSAPLQDLQFKLLCYDRENGDLLWEKVATEAKPHQATHSTNGFASASPCTDGEHVYAHFGSRGLYCYTMDGMLKWKRDDLGKMDTRNSFGEGSSPTLAGGKIIVPWDHEGPSAIFALNKLTGKTMWKTARDEPTCWATPLVIEHNGGRQVVMNGQTCVRSYDLETGEELWRCGGQAERPVACAVAGGGLVFVGSGHKGSFLAAFRPDGTGDIEGSEHVVWTITRDTPDIASLLLSSGRLYFHKGKTGILTCVDAATGKPHFEASRVSGLDYLYASPIAAGGYIFSTDRSGMTVVLKDAEHLEIVSKNSVGETVDATPAPVDDQLFIRGEEHLFCIAK